MSSIVFRELSKYYNHTAAVDDLSFTFTEKQVTAVIGPSGSGKSTLLQLINGLLVPDGGTVEVFGKAIDYTRLPELRRKIGYAVQGTGLFPHLSVAENISILAKLTGWDGARMQERLEGLMSLVNLPADYASKYPHELSGGEQQRVGICRAMMLNPGIFLLDEPFGALDPITRSEIHAEVLKLQEHEPRTIVLVTHDLREAFKLADTIIILNHGKIEQIGKGDDILETPSTPFVREFVHMQLEDNVPLPS